MITLTPRPRTNRGMKKTPKVVPFLSPEKRIIASDDQSQRLVLAIGKKRVAFPRFIRITELPPATGDRPAPVLPLKKPRQERRRSPAK